MACYSTRTTTVPKTDAREARDYGLLRRNRGTHFEKSHTHISLEKTYPQKRVESSPESLACKKPVYKDWERCLFFQIFKT